ncbi:hypothetical protein NU219Hw_g8532t1 [Hortaea werneckii]
MSTVVTRAASSTSAKPALQKRSRSAAGAAGGKKSSDHIKRRRLEQVPADSAGKDECKPHRKVAASDGEKRWQDYNQHSHQSPFSDFVRPTHEECEHAHRILEDLHGDKVRENFASDIDSVKYPHVMDAVVVAALSQATSWENAKRAMRNMDLVYGSTFAYDSIIQGGEEKLRQALRPGDDRIPNSLKFPLHYLLIVHGRECPNCKGSGNRPSEYSVLQAIRAATKDGFTR